LEKLFVFSYSQLFIKFTFFVLENQFQLYA
jgi:hypothetical protein